MGWSLTLGRIGGIPTRIHITFLALLAWVGLTEWQAAGGNAAVMAVAYVVLLFACVVAHEFGHILMARRFGVETEDVVLLPIGGVARMKGMPEKPAQELAVALAGPAVNVVIFAVLLAVIGPDRMVASIGKGTPQALVAELAAANIMLAVFNLLPAFPMDGGRALRALLALKLGRLRATDVAARVGHALALGMGLVGLLSGRPLLMLVAAFVYFGATSEAQGMRLHAFTSGLRAGAAMLTRIGVLGPEARLRDAVDLLRHSPQRDIPVLDGAGKPLGLLTQDALAVALHSHGADWLVIDAMYPNLPGVAADAALEEALRLLEQGAPAVAVVERSGALVGLITAESLGQLVMLNRHAAR